MLGEEFSAQRTSPAASVSVAADAAPARKRDAETFDVKPTLVTCARCRETKPKSIFRPGYCKDCDDTMRDEEIGVQ